MGSALLTFPPALDDVVPIKLAVVLLVAVALLASAGVSAVRSRRLVLPFTPVTVGAGVFATAAALTTVASDVPRLSLFGTYWRGTGSLLYLALVVILVVLVQRFDTSRLPALLVVITASAGVVSLWALLERFGLLGFGGDTPLGANAVFAALGNPNFVGAYLGIAAPLATWVALQRRWPVVGRFAGAAAAGLGIVASVLTESIQGPVVAIVGMTALALAWLWSKGGRARHAVKPGIALASLGGAVLLAGVLGLGPLSALARLGNVELRGYYWAAAVGMFSDNPVAGVGFDRYGSYYRLYQPLASSLQQGVSQIAVAPHNVTLGMFANGGLVLGLAYVAFVMSSGWMALRALRRHAESQRLLLVGAVAGAWLAYQVQSMVSIDVPAIALLHWTLAGALVVLAYPDGVPAVAIGHGRRRKQWGALEWAAVAAVALLAALALTFVTRPLRADVAAGQAQQLAAAGDAAGALGAIQRASDIAAWEPRYWIEQSRLHAQTGNIELSRVMAERAASADPRSLSAVVTSARAADHAGDESCAAAWYMRAAELEPAAPELEQEIAEFRAEHGDVAEPAECAPAAPATS